MTSHGTSLQVPREQEFWAFPSEICFLVIRASCCSWDAQPEGMSPPGRLSSASGKFSARGLKALCLIIFLFWSPRFLGSCPRFSLPGSVPPPTPGSLSNWNPKSKAKVPEHLGHWDNRPRVIGNSHVCPIDTKRESYVGRTLATSLKGHCLESGHWWQAPLSHFYLLLTVW